MPNSVTRYPFLQAFQQENAGSLYFLSDPHVRMRDPLATVHLVRFFAGAGINVRIQGVLAKLPHVLNDGDILKALEDAPEARQRVDALLKDEGKSVEDRVRELFRIAEKEDARQRGRHLERDMEVAPRGPVCILGRPQMYPDSFQRQINDELNAAEVPSIENGRFRLLSADPADPIAFRTFVDNYSGVTIPFVPYGSMRGTRAGEQDAQNQYVDYAVVRLVAGPYRNRAFLFVYGTSTLGTLAAAQALVDPDQNEIFGNLQVEEAYARHRSVEILLKAERRAALTVPWTKEFAPREITVVAPPVEPASAAIDECLKYFTTSAAGEAFDGCYLNETSPEAPGKRRFKIIGYNPPWRPGSCIRPWQMVGGSAIKRVTTALLEHARADTHNAVLLVGPTGVGKEFAARIIYEERTFRLLKRLGNEGVATRPVKIGSKYVALNAAALVETLAEAQLFGIRDGFVDNLGNCGALLGAGEGVVLLDELEAMAADRQAKLLRVVQPPYTVTPLGTVEQVPCTAAIVVATNEDPEALVSEGKLRADLHARLRPRTVRIPPLKERPSDIPGLLAYLAEEPIRFDERVLRCLLADPHHYNIRGLFQVIGRARRLASRAEHEVVGDGLEITFQALGPAVRNAFKDIIDEASARGALGSEEVVYEIEADRPPTVAQSLFEYAASILTSLWIDEDGTVKVRSTDKDYMPIWPRSCQYAEAKKNECDGLARQWVELVAQTVEAFPSGGTDSSQPSALDAALSMFGEMFQALSPSVKKRTHGIREWAAAAYVRHGARLGVKQKHYAMSLGMAESGFCTLIKDLAKPQRAQEATRDAS